MNSTSKGKKNGMMRHSLPSCSSRTRRLSSFTLFTAVCLDLIALVPAGGISAEKLFHMMKDQTITIIVMDARSHKDFDESHIQVPAQTCICVPEEAISPG